MSVTQVLQAAVSAGHIDTASVKHVPSTEAQQKKVLGQLLNPTHIMDTIDNRIAGLKKMTKRDWHDGYFEQGKPSRHHSMYPHRNSLIDSGRMLQ